MKKLVYFSLIVLLATSVSFAGFLPSVEIDVTLKSYKNGKFVVVDDYGKTYKVEEKELLLKELHHRVKNNLSIIKGIISLQDNEHLDIKGQQLLSDFKNRIDAVAIPAPDDKF